MKIQGTALISGASAGIGEGYARRLAASCDRLVLVARRRDRLADLASALAGRCEVSTLAADLGTVEGQAQVVEAIRQGPPLGLLINNAGFSTFGPFAGGELDAELAMLRLHQEATLALTRAALPAMCGAGTGGVINVASIGAFAAMPAVATYGATKAFLVSFSRSLRSELAATGVAVQCLCPGYTRTEIHSRDTFRGFDVARVPDRLWMEVDEVVDESLDALTADDDRWLVVTGEQNRRLSRQALDELSVAIGD